MLHSSTETEGLIKELVFFSGFEFYGDWNFPEAAILAPKFVLLACMHVESGSFDEKLCTF